MKYHRMRKFLSVIFLIVVLSATGCTKGGSDGDSGPGAKNVREESTVSSGSCAKDDPAADAESRTALRCRDTYGIGVGIADITGPAAEVTMGGFATSTQKTAGISMRLWSRAFIIADPVDPDKRVVFVSAELWAMCQAIKQEISRRLAAHPELGKYYNNDNVCLSATHTHSSMAGYSHYFLYNVPTQGFIKDSFDAVADGIFKSIERAHANIRPGRIHIAEGTLENAGRNRSAFAYDNNPADERARYDGNGDSTMTLLKFTGFDSRGREVGIGMLNWFAVHPTTVGEDNRLISSDSKGHASYMFEKHMGVDYTGPHTFVAAFAQANTGDVSPNVPFTKNKYSRETVLNIFNTYGITDPEGEIARQGLPWPKAKGEADIEENIVLKLEALRQYRKALDLYEGAVEPLHGSVDYRHTYADMSKTPVESAGCLTCPAGMGASYSYGSPSDNPSPYPLFGEGVTTDDLDSIDWNSSADINEKILACFLTGVEGLIWPPALSQEYIDCHGAKPVILPLGLMSFNLKKHIPLIPQILPVQVLKIGNLVIACHPTEITTMAGRRVRETLLESLDPGVADHAVIASMSNAYASYLATFEEYEMQGYEGGGTMFGPHQLEAFRQEYARLCEAVTAGTPVEPGPEPLDLRKDQLNFTCGVLFDDVPLGCGYGRAITQPPAVCRIGDKVRVTFWGAHPRNNRRADDGFLTVEQVTGSGNRVIRRDRDPDTKFIWKRYLAAYSKVTIEWNTKNASPGRYIIRYRGDRKTVTGKIYPITGASREFILK